MQINGRRIVFRRDPDTAERVLHVADYHDSSDALKGTELTAWCGRGLASLLLRLSVLLILTILAVIGIVRGQFGRYCEAQQLR